MRAGAIFDLDGTIIDNSSERELVKYLIRTRRVPVGNWFAWVGRFLRQRSLTSAKANKVYLRGLSVEELEEVASFVFKTRLLSHISPRALDLLQQYKRQGYVTVLLSGSIDLIVKRVGEYLGVDESIGFQLEVRGGRFTGRTVGIQPYREGKAHLLMQLAARYGLDLQQSYAYGNHRTDAYVLERVGHPVAVNPDRGLLRTARARGWTIEWFHR